MIPRSRQLPASIAALIDTAAAKYHVPASLARAVAWVESRGDATAKSAPGAMGVMQLMPKTAASLGVSDAFDPVQNIDAGVRYLSQLLARANGDEAQALASYNWGPGNVKNDPSPEQWPAQVQSYVRNVQARKVEEGGRSAASPFFGCSQLELRCPHCSMDVHVVVETELRR